MVQARGRLRFAFQTQAPFGVGREIVGQDLERDRTPEPRVIREIDLAHAAAPSADTIR